jgi:hypothetical protein
MTWRLVSAVSCFDARIILKLLHAESVGPLISKVLVEQAVIRQALDTTASLFSFASIDLPSLLDARTLSLDATLLGLSDAAAIPRYDHGQEANGDADF